MRPLIRGPRPAPGTLGREGLDALMPLHLQLDRQMRITHLAPTLRKLLGPDAPGRRFCELFTLRRPSSAAMPGDLLRAGRLRLELAAPPGTMLRGLAVPLSGPDAGALVNLSFGHAVREAVRDHALSDTDFAVTDLAIELLYLSEAKAAVMGEVAKMTRHLQSARRHAEEQALTDPLTGLHNRRAMERNLTLRLAQGHPFALMHLDLDHFKQVNDSFGHAAGDHVLCAFADILRRSVRGTDMAARIGGDEFIMLLQAAESADAVRRVAARVFARVKVPIDFQGIPCKVGASIGAALSRDHPEARADALLGAADRALYAAKSAGRGRLALAGPGGVALVDP
jgi:diguanylate cyclase (GGDEF)-like protein